MTRAEFNARVDERYRLMLDEVRARELWMSGDGRIGERDASALLGYGHPDSFRNARRRATGHWPRVYRMGGNRNKLTYQLRDLAAHVEQQALTPHERASVFSEVNIAGYSIVANHTKLV